MTVGCTDSSTEFCASPLCRPRVVLDPTAAVKSEPYIPWLHPVIAWFLQARPDGATDTPFGSNQVGSKRPLDQEDEQLGAAALWCIRTLRLVLYQCVASSKALHSHIS